MDKKVSIIEPLSREEKIKTAAYARVSSKSDDQIHSFNSQVAYYSQYINQLQNTIIVDVYTDEGITGTVIEKRNGFKKMIQDCRDGLIDRIITKSIARFGRNFTETLKTLRELKCLGVSIYFEEEHIDTADSVSETSISTYMMSAELESRTISYNLLMVK
ncbi:recombinase family protein [Longibaculum muris]|uniref:recombinase family protein n=1 Tax=Longibaculum muris TaxID=1796628 RepID=UPI0022E0FBBA|nr:recombinase family protein [Longibaculum muris]